MRKFILLLMLAITYKINAQLCFSPKSDYPAGSAPQAICTADFNGDGKKDLATTNYGTGGVSILLGNGNGTFGNATFFSVGTKPLYLTSADFNGDGKADLAVVHDSIFVSILIGTGTGSFGSATNFTVGSWPTGVASADFNGDSKADLAVTNSMSNNVSILIGNGLGSFSPATNHAVGTNPHCVTIADFNGDSKSDLAISNIGTSNVAILLGTGTGNFGAATFFTVNTAGYSQPESIVSADFNNDGKIDLATANYFSSTISRLLGTGTGSFGTPTAYGVGTNPNSIVSADFNGDGKADLATANVMSNNLSVLLGSGTGVFGTSTNFATGSSPYCIVSADFNGDGKKDLATSNIGSVNTSVLLNGAISININPQTICAGNTAILTASGANTYTWSANAGGVNTNTVQVSPIVTTNYTVNGTACGLNNTKIVAVNVIPTPTITVSISNTQICLGSSVSFSASGAAGYIWSTNGSTVSTSQILTTIPTKSGINNYSLTDNNGCGNINNYINVHPNVIFSAPNLFMPNSGSKCILSQDFNNDGKMDLITNSTNTDVILALGNGNGSFGTPVNFTAGTNTIYSMTSGDFNGDGNMDVASSHNGFSNNVSVLLGDGVGGLGFPTMFSAGTNPFSIITVDANNDGKLDLVTANGNTNNISVFLGTGTGSFSSAQNYSVGTNPLSLCSADFNGDGKIDLAVANSISNNITLSLGNGTGSFGPPSTLVATGSGVSLILTKDFNNDGESDIVFYSGSNAIWIMLGTGSGTFSTPKNYGINTTSCQMISYADFNNDGRFDLIGSNMNTNNAWIILGTGTGAFGDVINVTTPSTCLSGNSSVLGSDLNGDGITDVAVGSFGNCGVNVFLNGLRASDAQTLCSGSVLTLTATGTPNYSWSSNAGSVTTASVSVSPSNTTTYTVTGNDGVCYYSKTILVNVLPSPTVSVISSSPTTFCGNGTVTYTASGATSYSWGGGPFSSTATTQTISLNQTGDSYVTGMNSFGCSSQASFTITINPLPTITINTQTICTISASTLIASGASTYTWSTSQQANSIVVTPTTSTFYSVNGTDANGCVGTNNFVVGQNPTANFNYTVTNMTVNFEMKDMTCTNGGFLWDYGNGMTSTIAQQPFVTYNNSGVYTACLKCNSLPSNCVICANITVPGNYSAATSYVGIEEIQENNLGIKIYPNPSNGLFTIESKNENKVTVNNVLGENIHSQNIQIGKNNLNLNNQPNGIYFIKIQNFTYKIIVQN